MTPHTALPIGLVALAATALVACGTTTSAVGTGAPVPIPVSKTANTTTAGGASSPADMTRYKTQLAPNLFHNTGVIDSGFEALLSSQPAPEGAALAADIRRFALEPSIQLLNDAQGYVPQSEPLTSIHAIFLDSVNQKIRRYTALVDGATSGNRNDLAVAQAAAQQENADLKDWAKRVVALP
jgi:hypothetical protein